MIHCSEEWSRKIIDIDRNIYTGYQGVIGLSNLISLSLSLLVILHDKITYHHVLYNFLGHFLSH